MSVSRSCPWCGGPINGTRESQAARDAAPVPVTADAPAATPLLWWLLLYFRSRYAALVCSFRILGGSQHRRLCSPLNDAWPSPLWWAILRVAQDRGADMTRPPAKDGEPMIEIAIAAVGTLGWILGVGYWPSRFVGGAVCSRPDTLSGSKPLLRSVP